MFSAKLVVATVVGGARWFLGPVVGAAAFVLLQHVAHRFALSHGLILGALLVLAVLACPGGLAEAAAVIFGRARRPERPWTQPPAT